MIFEDNAVELLKRGQEELQKAVDSYSNFDLTSQSSESSSPVASSSDEKAQPASKQLRQNEDDGLCNGDLTEDDHGKKFVSDDDEFFEGPAQKKIKLAAMMEAQCEILQERDSYEDYKCYDGATATMETYDEAYIESTFAAEEVQYSEEFTDHTYDVSTMY